MGSITILLTFLILVCLLLSHLSSVLLVLVLLEFLTFLVLWGCTTVVPSFFSSTVTLILFSLFVLESVLGLILLINLVSISGTDYIKVSLSH